jgi:hypothetical protein
VQRIHKTLGLCLLVTALVFGVLKMLGGVGFGDKANGEAKAPSQDLMTRHDRGQNASDSSTRKLRQRARKLTSTEAKEFLKTTIIPRLEFNEITLSDALKIVNEEIAKQTPDDQPRPRILMDPKLSEKLERNAKATIDDLLGRSMLAGLVLDIRVRQIPVSELLKFIRYQTHTTYWFYKGDYYLSSTEEDGGIGYSFYYSENLDRVKLENIDASQLAKKLNEIIEQHDYFGFKTSIDIKMTKKARAALLKGEVKLPRIDLDLENVTLKQAIMQIEVLTNKALVLSDESLLFNPFHEVHNTDPFAAAGEGVSFDIILNEDTMNSKFVPAEDPFE